MAKISKFGNRKGDVPDIVRDGPITLREYHHVQKCARNLAQADFYP